MNHVTQPAYFVIASAFLCLALVVGFVGCGSPGPPPLTEAELAAKTEAEEAKLEKDKEKWGYVAGLLVEVDFRKTKAANYDTNVILKFDDGRIAILEKDSYLPLVFHIGNVNRIWYDEGYGTIKRVEFDKPLQPEEE